MRSPVGGACGECSIGSDRECRLLGRVGACEERVDFRRVEQFLPECCGTRLGAAGGRGLRDGGFFEDCGKVLRGNGTFGLAGGCPFFNQVAGDGGDGGDGALTLNGWLRQIALP